MHRTADFPQRLRAFTLLEMIVVVAITAALLLTAAAAFTSSMQASAITADANSLRDALKLGRATAIAQNTTVEVRFYAATSPTGVPVYNAMQLHWLKADGSTPPVAQAVLLSSWSVLDSSPAYSSLLASTTNTQSPTPDPSDRLLGSATRVFHYLADGTTDLNPATNWCVTLRPANSAGAPQLPPNCACIVVDATTGRPQIFRP